ncbi:vesicle transport protein USE1 [Trichoderma asperellum]|uniref:Vesicle transport protein USE1 n=1 Tax=Trichoderma asperellum TaxID=101201 RepID=A0A6V8QY44_TRIAP|nr:vesicle transport protein USE1 [Trichoderma asperellum]
MALLPNLPAGEPPNLSPVELAQLLSRLKQSVLHPSPERERRLRNSEFERTRVEANLQYARAALTKLEQTLPGRRADTHGDLTAQREILDLLFDRLDDLRKVAVDEDDSSEEDLLGDIIPTPSESVDSRRSSNAPGGDSFEEPKLPEPEPPEPPTQIEAMPEPPTTTTTSEPAETSTREVLPTQTTQTLRARHEAPSPTPSSHSTARAALFANRRKPASPQTSTATAEAILDQQRAEQDAISNSILDLASKLKESSKSFSATLEEDKNLLSTAGASMEKSELSMEAAQGRMGSLKKMTEGKGWWGRMMLYAWVYGLMVALILFVFVFPKLRF